MFNTIKKRVAAGTVLLAGVLGAPLLASAQNYLRSFTIVNESSFTIRRIYVSPTNYRKWGYDRLGTYVLNPSYKVTIDLEPGFYDVKLVDEDGDSCVVSNVDFRSSDTAVLNNANLLACENLH